MIEHHQWKLEVHVDEGDAPELEEAETVVPRVEADLAQPVRGDTRRRVQRRDEHEGEVHPTELRQYARARRGQALEQRVVRRRDGVGQERSEDAGDDRGDERELQAVLETRSVLAPR